MKPPSPRHAYRLPPCPDYDVEGTQSWLTDLAAQGLHLARDGLFLGIACFEKGEPQSVRYRLEAAEKTTSMWAEDGGLPENAAVELSRELGWEYVANRGQFYIYRSAAPGVRELNTDPAVQALALDVVCKRQRRRFVNVLADILFWLLLYPLLQLRGAFFLLMLAVRTWFFLFGAALLLWELGRNMVQLLHLSKLKHQLQSAGSIDHAKDWKSKAAAHHLKNALRRGLIVLWLLLLLLRWNDDALDKNKRPLADCAVDPPFATLADLAGEGGSYELQSYGFSNTVEVWSDLLAPVNCDWNETADVTLPDGRRISGGLRVYYHETRSPALARAIAEEYVRKDRYDHVFSLLRESRYEPLALGSVEADFAAAYTGSLHFPTLVLQTGNKLLRAEWYQVSEDKLTVDEWAALLAGSIRAP